MSKEPTKVYCFGTNQFRIIKGKESAYVKIYNPKLKYWMDYPLHDYIDECPTCGKPIHIFYIPGTTYLACCSKECYEEYDKREEL